MSNNKYISQIKLNNFRVFEHSKQFDLKPITFLVGPNNSGKSNIWKALLLLKETMQKRGGVINIDELDYTNSATNLISHKLTLNEKDKDNNTFSIGYTIDEKGHDNNTTESYYIHLVYGERDKKSYLRELEIRDGKNDTLFIKAGGSIDTVFIDLTTTDFWGDLRELDNIATKRGRGKKDETQLPNLVNNDFLKKASYLSYEDILHPRSSNPITNIFHFIDYLERRTLLDDDISDSLSRNYTKTTMTLKATTIRKILISILSHIYTEVTYINAVRSKQRLVFYEGDVEPFGKILADFQRQPVEYQKEIIDFINESLNILNPLARSNQNNTTIKLNIEKIRDNSYNNVSLQWGDSIRELVQLGYGISQLIPFLLQIGLSKGKTLILEEPENSLHPNFQSKLGDIFILANIQLGVNFIIETHSEYLIRKVQYLVKHQKAEASDIAIIYLDGDSENNHRQINIKPNGFLTQLFGVGFFDETTDLINDLYD